MKTIISILLAFTIIFLGCEKDNIGITSENIKLIVDAKEYLSASGSESVGDSFEIDNVLKDGSQLYIDVKYGGGCKEHSFEIIWGGDFIKTNPPSIQVIIVHDANNDMCEAYLSNKLKIDLKDLMGMDYVSLLNVIVINGYDKEIYVLKK